MVIEDRYLGGTTTCPGTQSGGLMGRKSPTDQGRADAGQDIPHTTATHAGISGGIKGWCVPRLRDEGSSTL
jgi:hypothetical protein